MAGKNILRRREKIINCHIALSIRNARLFAAVAFVVLLPGTVSANWTPLIERLIADKFDETYIRMLFVRPEVRFDPAPMVIKLKTLIQTRDLQPSTSLNVRNRRVDKGYLRSSAMNAARAYYAENRIILGKIRKKYCIPEEVIVAILAVETNLGRNTGKRLAFNVLASMAFCDDLNTVRTYLQNELAPPDTEAYAQRRCREKSEWAYNELKYLIKYAQDRHADPLAIPGSIYGAIGLCQFMPSNVFLYGVDADENGHVDLFSSPDALYSVGNYLRMNGWKCRMDRMNRHKVILTYNRSQVYANTVLAVADRLHGNTGMLKKRKGHFSREG